MESLAINTEETTPTLKDVVAYLKKLDKNSWDYFSEVFTLVKLILVVPALSERSCSALIKETQDLLANNYVPG